MTDGVDGEVLDLTDEHEVGFADELPEQDGGESDRDDGETVIAFADEVEGGEPETTLVTNLRKQLREAQRKARHAPASQAQEADPEPVVPPFKRIEDFDYDGDRQAEYITKRDEALLERAKWGSRQTEREAARKREAEQQNRQIEQQRNALGVSDYDARSARVREALSDAQIAVLLNGVENQAQLIYALGGSQAKLDTLAGEDNLARFAVMLGKLEKDVKVQKRKAPPPEIQVRGATASIASGGADKELERLEKEAARTNDRSKVIAHTRKMRAA